MSAGGSLGEHLARLVRHSGIGAAEGAGAEGRPDSPDSFVISLGSPGSPGSPGSTHSRPGSPMGEAEGVPAGALGSPGASTGTGSPAASSSSSDSEVGSDVEQTVRGMSADDWSEGGRWIRRKQRLQAHRWGRERWGPDPAASPQQLADVIVSYMEGGLGGEAAWSLHGGFCWLAQRVQYRNPGLPACDTLPGDVIVPPGQLQALNSSAFA